VPGNTPVARQTVALTPAQTRTVCRILGHVIPGAEVQVFGSRATGRARPFSDLDLLVVNPSRLSWAQRADLHDLFEASDLPFLVDIVEVSALAHGMADRVRSECILISDTGVAIH
jgi:uncharacterized protein